jgi:hypothetical protein
VTFFLIHNSHLLLSYAEKKGKVKAKKDKTLKPESMLRTNVPLGPSFNIIHPASGLKVDIIIRRDTPFDASRFRRIRRIHPADTYEANFAAPEDVIIKKMEYYKAGGSNPKVLWGPHSSTAGCLYRLS